MRLKNKEKISIIVPIIICILCLCSCSKKTPDEKLTDGFLEYSLGKTDGKFNRVFTTSNGTEMVISELTKEDVHYPKVLLSVEIGNTDFKNQIYQWITSPVNVRMDDYEKDMIYIPNAENIYKEMYEQFGTFHAKDVAEADGGTDFIIDNNLGYWQHNELETKDVTSYSIFLHDGKFSEYEKDKSTAYSRDDVSE